MEKVRIAIPETAEAGAVIEIKTLISHPMESGFRRGARGELLPRNILTRFTCHYNERPVFTAALHPGVAANPYLSFFVRIDVSGTFDFQWIDEHGQVTRETRSVRVPS